MNNPGEFWETLQNVNRIYQLTQRLFGALSRRDLRNPLVEGPGFHYYVRAIMSSASGMVANPFTAINAHLQAITASTAYASEVYQMILTGELSRMMKPGAHETDEAWARHPFYLGLKHWHKFVSSTIDNAIVVAETPDEKTRQQLGFFANQIKAMLAPENYLLTNPAAVRKMIETNGQSVVNGLEHLVEDVERADGDFLVALADPTGFTVGKDLAKTSGYVVYETPLFQLIHYEPRSPNVYATPIVMIPPWVNKFYIMDLQEKNSMIKWILEQGFSVYMVSWRNPDGKMRDMSLDDYILNGVVAAVEKVRKLTDQQSVNLLGYCIGGFAAVAASAWYTKQANKSPIRSLTLFTTFTDFSEPGSLKVFADPSFTAGLMHEMYRTGVFDKRILARTFSFLRPNDLVYEPAIHSYLLGEERPKFDLLFWNGDSTNLPAKMASELLIRLLRDNEFTKGKFTVNNVPISIGDIKTPIYAVTGETDHIVPWKSSFKGLAKANGNNRYVVSRSGHIAGIINHPSRNKYGYWVSDEKPTDCDAWLRNAELNEGSWWPDWARWLTRRSGKKIDIDQGWPDNHPKLEPAPGSYVKA